MTALQKFRIVSVPRPRDEQLLGWLRMRSDGVPANAIARRYGVNSGVVIIATNNVMQDDLWLAEEPESLVRRAYW
ncbi:hypothetical protein [Sagittula sp. S175]|uniref:hypothetical protein n=1 Tax=Sagittula sp. S175 TaxID=3415129 RepID=UPI003C7ED1A8